jgi:hypothetical protein
MNILSYFHHSGLIQEMQKYLDAKHPPLCLDNGDNSGDDSSGSTNDGFVLEKTNLTIIG